MKNPEDSSVYGNQKWEQLLQKVILKYVDLALKAFEIVYRSNGSAVERLDFRNWHKWKVVCEGESVSWGYARTKGNKGEWKLTKNMFLDSDLLKFCLKKKHNIIDFLPDKTMFYD